MSGYRWYVALLAFFGTIAVAGIITIVVQLTHSPMLEDEHSDASPYSGTQSTEPARPKSQPVMPQTGKQDEVLSCKAPELRVVSRSGKVIVKSVGTHQHDAPQVDTIATFTPKQGQAEYWNDPRYDIGKPGSASNNVVTAHSVYNTPDVFWDLDEVRQGDLIEFSCGTRKRVWHASQDAMKVSKDDMQDGSAGLGKRIWNEPGLKLVTCDQFSNRQNGEFVDGIIVFAE